MVYKAREQVFEMTNFAAPRHMTRRMTRRMTRHMIGGFAFPGAQRRLGVGTTPGTR
jgi:hypothetical protein